MVTIKQIEEILQGVMHPAFDKSVIELGLIEDIKIEGDETQSKVKFKLVFPRPDALSTSIKKSCEEAILSACEGRKVSILELVRESKPQKKKVSVNGEFCSKGYLYMLLLPWHTRICFKLISSLHLIQISIHDGNYRDSSIQNFMYPKDPVLGKK